MGNIFKNEKHMRILKSLSVKLSERTTFILTYMYYTDKYNKDNNQYRYEGMVVDNEEMEGRIRKLESEPNLPWHWKNGIPDNFVMSYHGDTNRQAASFYKNRLLKTVSSWEEFLEKANENPVKRYPLKDYRLENETIDITDKEKLLSLVGKSFSHVRDRAERTFDVYDKNRVFRRYNSKVQQRIDREKALLEKRFGTKNGTTNE